jgi:26S proteasome regulatory subunit N13
LELLPEEQRTMEHLQDNLMSPQIQQTLRALSQAMLPDEQGQLDGYHSVIANFQLDPRDGEAALTSGNPIQAFLDCVLASVEKEESEEQEGQQQHEEEEEESMQE